VKNDILAPKTHQLAAYEQVPLHYQWIRLHHGIIIEKGLSEGLTLNKTRYYLLHSLAQPPTTYIQTYDPPVAVR
jgi:hypothetical protein